MTTNQKAALKATGSLLGIVLAAALIVWVGAFHADLFGGIFVFGFFGLLAIVGLVLLIMSLYEYFGGKL